MATIKECLDTKQVRRWGGALMPGQQPERLLMVSAGVVNWMKTVLPTLPTDGFFPGSPTPQQQAQVFARKFRAGEGFDPPLPHEMRPLGQGVWRLRTADLRMDGWLPAPYTFVIAAMDAKSMCKGARSDAMYAEVLAFRAALNMLGGTYLTGDIHDHL